MLQDMLDESVRDLEVAKELAKELSPIARIAKIRVGQRGAKKWGLDMWELILEQLVNGTPPSAVKDNIVTHLKKFSPKTKIVELPSIWTIRRARTVLLVICQTLAAYRLGKAAKWGQLCTDGTSRRQVKFKNLVISIEDDELFQ